MFHPKRGNNAAEVRVNIEPLDVSEEARALLRGVYQDGHRAELAQIGSSALPDSALPMPMPSRSLCPPVATKAQNLQTTYTTAGTIYDPNTRLLIQPPNRRGRSSKHGPTIPLSDQALLAGSASILDPSGKLEGSGGGRMTTAASLRNYTPLQQNYDRAINPINPCNDLDHQRPVSMPIQMPRKKASDGLSSYRFDSELEDILGCASSEEGDCKDRLGSLERDDGRARSRLEMRADARDLGPGESIGGDGQDEEESEKENDWGMDPLMNMPVKSLHNLASYPNPNQKKAQKILLMGAKPKLMKNLKLGSSFPTASGSDPSRRPESALGQDESSIFDGYHPGLSFSMADDHKAISLGNPLGSGAPKPLTAGPPGQRQYRPSNLGSVPRGMSPRHLLLPHYPPSNNEEGFTSMRSVSAFAGIDETKVTSASSSTSGRYTHEVQEQFSKFPPSDVISQREPSTHDALDTSSDPWLFKATARQDEQLLSYTRVRSQRDGSTRLAEPMAADDNAPPSESWKSMPGSSPVCDRSAPSDLRLHYDEGVGRLSANQIAERNERIHSLWFQGTGLFAGPADDPHESRSRQSPAQKSPFGAVGDGRPLTEAKTQKTSIEL